MKIFVAKNKTFMGILSVEEILYKGYLKESFLFWKTSKKRCIFWTNNDTRKIKNDILTIRHKVYFPHEQGGRLILKPDASIIAGDVLSKQFWKI